MLSHTANSAVYHADGGTAVFPIPFPFQQDSHIHAHLRGPAGGRTLTRGKDYAVRRTGEGSGGEIVLLGDLPGPGTELVVRRLLPLTQEILFHNQGPNSPAATEEAIDKLTMIAQQLAGGLERSMPVPPADGKRYLAAGEGWVEYAPPPAPPLPLTDHAQLRGRSTPAQHPQSAISGLPADLEAIRAALRDLADAPPPPPALGTDGAADGEELARLSIRVSAVESSTEQLSASASQLSASTAQLESTAAELEASTAGLGSGLAAASTGLAGVQSDLAAVQAGLAGLGVLARCPDAPSDGEAYLRQDGGWVRHAADGGSSSGGSGASSGPAPAAYLGEIRLLPFRPGELPAGWRVCDGATFPWSSAEFDAISRLPANFISDWGINRTSVWAALPDLRGSALRAAGAGESVGSVVAGAGAGGTARAMTAAMYLGCS